jgi:hypothetical protein
MRVFGAIFAVAVTFGVFAGALAQDEMPADAPAAGKSAPRPVPTPLSSPPAPGKNNPVTLPSATADEPPGIAPPGTMIDQPIAVLQALDKISARVRRLTVKVGQAAPFGTLSITVDACRKAPPEDPPESAAFLKITDTKPGEASQTVFSGWMFASSPALSAMDHPVYDIWVVDCSSEPTASATPAQ